MSRWPWMDAELAPPGPSQDGYRTVLLYTGTGITRHLHHQLHALSEAEAAELVRRINAPNADREPQTPQ